MSTGRFRLISARARRFGSGGGTTTPITLLARPFPITLSAGNVRSVAPTDTGDRPHFIGYSFSSDSNWRLGIGMDATGDGLFFGQQQPGRFSLYRGKLSDTSTWFQINAGLFKPYTAPATGARFEARLNEDLTLGLYADNVPVIIIPTNSGHLSYIKGNFVAFSQTSGNLPNDVTFGTSSSPLGLTSSRYVAADRSITLTGTYSALDAGGTIPSSPQVDYGDGVFRSIDIIANPSAGRMTLKGTVPKSISGYKSATVRWGNKPTVTQPFAFDAVIPFGGRLGGNDGNSEWTPFLFGGWDYLRAEAQNGKGIAGLYQASDGVSSWRGTVDGINGVQRDVEGGFGRNDRGIVKYVLRKSLAGLATPLNAGDYTMQFPPGLAVVPDDGFGMGVNLSWAYNQTTGLATFTLKSSGSPEIRLVITVSSIVANTIVPLPYPRKTTTPSNQVGSPQYILFQKGVSDGPRPLDSLGAYNNKNVNNRTLTAMAVNTTASEGTRATNAEIGVINEMDAKFCCAFNSHIDDVGLVTWRAQQYASRTSASVDVFVYFGNENIWNVIFTHGFDIMLEGIRQGFHAVGTAADTRTTTTVWDGGNYGGVPRLVTNNSGQGTFTVNYAIPAGTNFFVSIDGGYYAFTATIDLTVGTLVNYNPAKLGTSGDVLTMLVNNQSAVQGGYRYISSMVKRNLGIWRTVFANAGRPAPFGVVDGQAGDPNQADITMSWDNLRQYLAQDRGGRLAIAPYFNNEVGGYNMMNYNESRVWDATAKDMISAGDYDGAAAYITPRAIELLSIMDTAMVAYKANLYAKNVAAGLAPDAVRLFLYEFGDHSVYAGYPNWPSAAIGAAFYYNWIKTSYYYDFMKAYYRVIGSIGAEGFTYTTHTGDRPFGLGTNYEDLALDGPNVNYAYKAIKESLDDAHTAVAAA